MGYEKMTCRVCGKKYEPCRTAKRNTNVFHWQEVACSPECGSVYLKKINESRGIGVERDGRSKNRRRSEKTDMVCETVAAVETEMAEDITVAAISDINASDSASSVYADHVVADVEPE